MKNLEVHNKIMALQELTGANASEMAKACKISVHTYNKRKGGKYGDHYFIEENYHSAITYFINSFTEKIKILETL